MHIRKCRRIGNRMGIRDRMCIHIKWCFRTCIRTRNCIRIHIHIPHLHSYW